MTPKPIPEWFDNWISDWLKKNIVTQASENEDIDITLDRHNAKTTWATAIAIAAYRLLSDQGIRWVKASAELPPENKLVYCRTSRGRKIVTSAAKGEWDNYWLNEDEESVIEWLLEPESTAPIQ